MTIYDDVYHPYYNNNGMMHYYVPEMYVAKKLNQEQEIKVLKDEVEAVRKLPDVYIGALGDKGFVNMVREIVQNSTDAIIKGLTNNMNIMVKYDARDHYVFVEDNGPGIPLNMLEQVFSVLHSSSNYDKKEGSGLYSAGKNGMGATITNFLSEQFAVISYREDGTCGSVEFKEGRLSGHMKKLPNANKKHGLVTAFKPSKMMGNITVTDTDIYELVWMLCHLCVIGTKIEYTGISITGKETKTVIENKHGIFDMIGRICEQPVINPIYFTLDNGTMKCECLLTYDVKHMDDPIVTSFANMCPTDGGTHVDGFLNGVVKYFRDYMNKIYLANNKKLQVNAQDIRTGLRSIVSIYHLFPMFTGKSLAPHYGNVVLNNP